jgi:hypothetical protein
MRSVVSRTNFEPALSSDRSAIKPSGGARRDRTDDLMLAKHALSQLSYGPVTRRRMLCTSPCSARGSATRSRRRSVVGLGRLELPTSRLSSARSNQLSYKPLNARSSSPLPAQVKPTRADAATAQPQAACSSAKKEKRRRRNPANGAHPRPGGLGGP